MGRDGTGRNRRAHLKCQYVRRPSLQIKKLSGSLGAIPCRRISGVRIQCRRIPGKGIP